jgi:C_GCAxxG_C_C family probable redox protein
MKRRQFLETCAAGVAAAGSLSVAANAQGAETAAGKSTATDPLAKAASEHFLVGNRACSESIVMAGCEALGIKSELIPDIALGLAGGVGGQGDTCGVLTGAALVLSAAIARKEAEYPKKKLRIMQAAGRLHSEFKTQFGCTSCRLLCGLDLTAEEGRKKLAAGVKAEKCAKFVEAGAKLLARELDAI